MKLIECLEAVKIELPNDQVQQLEHYCELLWSKNQVMNLTRHTDYQQFVNRDLVDTLALAKQLRENDEILDVGSGGGVPGLVLGIVRPDLMITLCDSVGKKAAALSEICRTMNLEIEVAHTRAERILEDNRFDAVTARAVGPLAKMLPWFQGCWANMTRLLAIKGPKWREERLAAESERLMKYLVLKVVDRYPIPGEEWESVILEIRRSS